VSNQSIFNALDSLVVDFQIQSKHIMLMKQKSFSGRSSLASMLRLQLTLFAPVTVNSRNANVRLYVMEGIMGSFQISQSLLMSDQMFIQECCGATH
jgi:hypothetical protein